MSVVLMMILWDTLWDTEIYLWTIPIAVSAGFMKGFVNQATLQFHKQIAPKNKVPKHKQFIIESKQK